MKTAGNKRPSGTSSRKIHSRCSFSKFSPAIAPERTWSPASAALGGSRQAVGSGCRRSGAIPKANREQCGGPGHVLLGRSAELEQSIHGHERKIHGSHHL